jgi:hypothetical protein
VSALRRVLLRIDRRRPHGDAGALSVFVVGIAVTLLVLAGLVVDGGTAINARQTIADDTEQAARAGAMAIDEVTLRSTGQVVLNRADAQRRASDYLVGLGYPAGRISFPDPPDARSITVSAQDTVPTKILSLIARPSFDVRASATARAATGITVEVP